jgi:hypothetical protein
VVDLYLTFTDIRGNLAVFITVSIPGEIVEHIT